MWNWPGHAKEGVVNLFYRLHLAGPTPGAGYCAGHGATALSFVISITGSGGHHSPVLILASMVFGMVGVWPSSRGGNGHLHGRGSS